MKLTNDQFEALAYIFERENGNDKSKYESEVIADSGIAQIRAEVLEQNVVDGLKNGMYDGEPARISAYWALGKRFNENLIPFFKKWLRKEVDLGDEQAVYQLLISLGNLGEPVFNPDREGGSAYYETELNMRDAKDYLVRTAHNNT